MRLKKIYTRGYDFVEKLREIVLRRIEVKKFKDPRRVAIYSKLQLTNKQKEQIDNFYIENYGQKVPHIWHRHYTAFTGNFDINYLPELVYAPEFEEYMHGDIRYCKVLADKNLLPYLAQAAGIKMAHTLLSRAGGMFRGKNNELLSQKEFESLFGSIGEAFVKPSVGSNSGLGCRVVNMQNGVDTLSGKNLIQIIHGLGMDFIVQKRLHSHPLIAALYPHSVNTFRIVTYRWKEEILHARILLKIGCGGKNVENAHAGGIFIAVEDNGTLHATAFTEFNKQFHQHPDTHIVFKDYKIPHVNKLIAAAKEMHALLPQIGIYHWDFVLGEDGEPVLMEANTGTGGIGSIQMAHGKGLFGDKTAEILRWTAKMKKLPYSKRKFYRYGYMDPQR